MENCYICTRRDQFGGVGFCSAASAIADGGEKASTNSLFRFGLFETIGIPMSCDLVRTF